MEAATAEEEVASDDDPAAKVEEPQEATEVVAEAEEAAPEAKEEASSNGKQAAKKRPKRTQQQANVSREEELIRGFHALHTLLNNQIWCPITIDTDAKPSSIFAPRQHFDKQWADQTFKDGLKAASKLANSYTFNPDNIDFDQRVIDAISGFKFDPNNSIKPHTELIGKAIGSKTAETVLKMMKRGDVSKLLHSAGTRLATFVPTIEILARIYLGLRKKDDIIPGERLRIQEEVLMKYSNGPYTEDMGKKARNLSLNYFTDYLSEYGIRLYNERVARAPEGQNNLAGQKRRHETIKDNCVNLMRDWGTKTGMSTPAMWNLEARFSEMADKQLAELVGEVDRKIVGKSARAPDWSGLSFWP